MSRCLDKNDFKNGKIRYYGNLFQFRSKIWKNNYTFHSYFPF